MPFLEAKPKSSGCSHHTRSGAPAPIHSQRQHVSSQLAIPQSQKPSCAVWTTQGHCASTPRPAISRQRDRSPDAACELRSIGALEAASRWLRCPPGALCARHARLRCYCWRRGPRQPPARVCGSRCGPASPRLAACRGPSWTGTDGTRWWRCGGAETCASTANGAR